MQILYGSTIDGQPPPILCHRPLLVLLLTLVLPVLVLLCLLRYLCLLLPRRSTATCGRRKSRLSFYSRFVSSGLVLRWEHAGELPSVASIIYCVLALCHSIKTNAIRAIVHHFDQALPPIFFYRTTTVFLSITTHRMHKHIALNPEHCLLSHKH